jgi:transcriptional regulator with XRE-family HTH domain
LIKHHINHKIDLQHLFYNFLRSLIILEERPIAHIIDGPNSEFALRLRDVRKKTGHTQEEIAKSIGIDKRTISMYENGRMFPRGNTLQRLATELQVEPLWLTTGQNEDMQNYFENQYKEAKLKGSRKSAELIFVEDWSSLQPGKTNHLPRYVPNQSSVGQSCDIGDFVPVVKTVFDQYRATRYPATYPQNPSYPNGSILIFDAGIPSLNNANNGDDLIFRFRGNENEAGLRRFSRELGLNQGSLVSLNPAMPLAPIPADPSNIEILGVVVSQVITRRA